MSTRPDDDSDDKPERPAPDDASPSSREDRVRGGFFQSDDAGADGASDKGSRKDPRKHSAGGASEGSGDSGEDGESSQRGFDPASFLFGAAAPFGSRRPDDSDDERSSGRKDSSGSGGPRRPSRPTPGAADGPRRPGPLAWTLGILAALAAVVIFLSRTWTEVLWFDQLGFARVVWTQWIAAGVMFVVGFLIMFGAVFAAITRAYRSREIGLPHDEATRNLEAYRTAVEPMRRALTWGVPGVVALLASAWELAPHWQEALLAIHSHSFGVADPQFGLDISFYVFILPVLEIVVSFLTRVVVIAGIASVVVHYLYGGVSVARKPHFTRAARLHLTVFLALFSVLHGAGYWLGRYSSLYASNTKFDGAGYTDVHASIPAQAILAAISVAVAVLFVASARTSSWRLPVTGVTVMVISALIVGVAYPVVIQKFVVDPNAQREESEYIDRNIKATLSAYGLGDVDASAYNAKTTAEAGQLMDDAESTTSIRLLDPNLVSPAFKQRQQNKQYYSFDSQLNVDRYGVSGESRDTVIAVRELSQEGLENGQRTWINDHTVYTHGYGVVTAYGNTSSSDGSPAFWEGGIPSEGELGDYEPRIYFGKSTPSYSIVGGDDGGNPRELDYPDDSAPSGQINTTFSGSGGPNVSNPFNRLLYATKFAEMNILFSQEVRSGSQILYDRDPAKRVAKVAPWLTLDGNPYPAVIDDDDDPSTPKRVKWILDGYTTTNNYPYSQHESLEDSMSDATTGQASLLGAPKESNYVRNSVKAVVDAYDGSVKLYEWDEQDPLLDAWQSVFPGTVTPMSEMSTDLMAHMRYPEDLFKVQRTVMATYHVTDPEDFYSGGDFWKVPDDPTKEGDSPQAPYYLTLKMPDQDEASFSLSSVYIIGGNTDRNVLTGFLAVDSETASGEPGVRNPDYGKLRLLELPRSSNVSGPGQVQNNFNSDGNASQVLNLLSQQGSQVIKGNLLTLPVGGGLLYVQPVYVQSSSGTQYPLLRKVLVSFGDKIGFADTLKEALNQVFGGDSGATTGQEVVDGDSAAANDTSSSTDPSADSGTEPTADPSAAASASAQPPTASAQPSASASASGSASASIGDPQTDLDTALADAKSAMDDSNKAMQSGDWTAYGEAQTRLNNALNRAVEAQKKLGG